MNESQTMDPYVKKSKELYVTVLFQLKAWDKNNENLSDLSFTLLNRVPLTKNVDKAVKLLSSKRQVINIFLSFLMNSLTWETIYRKQKLGGLMPQTLLSNGVKWSFIWKQIRCLTLTWRRLFALQCANLTITYLLKQHSLTLITIWTEEKSQPQMEALRTVMAVRANTG